MSSNKKLERSKLIIEKEFSTYYILDLNTAIDCNSPIN